ncbi:MAG: cupredoxin domain-containing protein [Terriglobia bacterium]
MVRITRYASACALLVGLAVVALAQTPATSGEAHEFQMTAKKYQFDPNVITVKKGEHVKLVITALDRDHGFKLEAFGIDQKLKKGDPTTVEFTADKAGTFPFKCSDFCGFGHGKMKGKLVVEE